MENKSTMTDLVVELEAANIDTPFMKVTIEEAKKGEYHDYKNDKYVCGKVALVERLNAMKLYDLAERVINGEYDEKPDAEDKKMLDDLSREMGFQR